MPIENPTKYASLASSIKKELGKEITGMEPCIHSLLVALVAQGHVLLEGMPGLAKTLLAKSLAKTIDANFARIQFTPDLLPADLVGTNVFHPKTANFQIRKGPVFTNVLLADEINRAPAKVQSALLQCMEERLVTIADTTFSLVSPFFVLATQNPIDQEGTYTLPEAQTDRFLFKVKISYPSFEDEVGVLSQHGKLTKQKETIEKKITTNDLSDIAKDADLVFVDPKLESFIVRLVRNSRPESTSNQEVQSFVRHGASPRASLALLKASKANALWEGRDFVIPEDIIRFAYEVLSHRIQISIEGHSEEVSSESIVKRILEITEVP